MSNEPRDLIDAPPAMDAGSRALAQIRNLQRALANAIDTPAQPPHANPEPWRAHGFEECSEDEALQDGTGMPVASWSRSGVRGEVYLRPSPLVGLKRALEIIGNPVWSNAVAIIRAEIAKYEPPVCSTCGQPVTRKGEP